MSLSPWSVSDNLKWGKLVFLESIWLLSIESQDWMENVFTNFRNKAKNNRRTGAKTLIFSDKGKFWRQDYVLWIHFKVFRCFWHPLNWGSKINDYFAISGDKLISFNKRHAKLEKQEWLARYFFLDYQNMSFLRLLHLLNKYCMMPLSSTHTSINCYHNLLSPGLRIK